jgi:hypothetical protein
MGRPTKPRQARQAALREELQSREYLRQIHAILERDWKPEETGIQSAKLTAYFKLLAKSLPDCKELPVVLSVDPALPLARQAETVASAVLAGTITPTQADSLLNILERVSNVRATHDLEQRILKLELEANEDSD